MRCLMWLCMAGVVCLFAGCHTEESERTIKLAHSLGVEHPVHEAMVYMASELEKNSRGQLTLEIYPSSQLGSEQQCLELLQIGSLGMTKVSAAVMENFSPRLKVFGFPYLFRDDAHRFAVCDGPIGQQLLLEGQEYWLRGLTYFDAGERSFYTKEEPIEKPADLEGLKIRVMQSPTAIDMVKRLGGSPTPISWGELYTALQQGVVDGAENNIPSFYSSRHYEVCKYFSLDEHASIPDILVISTLVWERLSEEERGWLMQAVDSATVYQRKLWQEAEAEAMVALQEAGVKIYRPEKSAFETKAQGMIQDLKADDPDLYELINDIKNLD
ncbi:TRAP transporter substrate-binding protein [Roseivirga sp. BDSF3-8]|uniref:TRAP transporter substrate-binding protein n=1 Tax=Roseivirga sp. BDSF3-8 TaxID=3241598 RepID=UPI0035327387